MKFHYISPYSRSKNFGGAINDAVNQLCPSPEDWIIHVDQDVCFLLPDTKAHIEEILEGTDFDLLGCMTNRCNVPAQQTFCVPDYPETDVKFHQKMAMARYSYHNALVSVTGSHIAAFLLCFRYSTFTELGGFEENTMHFDKRFCKAALKACKRIGIMQGIYVYHHYRMWSDNPVLDTKHLQ